MHLTDLFVTVPVVASVAKSDSHAFFEYMVQHNQEYRDAGEVFDISDKEKRRLEKEWRALPPEDKLKYHRQVGLSL
jgi:hypothetical protein